MVANPSRRADIFDAALAALGRDGARALTHRAVDARADLPPGTTTNYARTRADLLRGMAERIFVHLAPDPRRLRELERLDGAPALTAYVSYVVERLLDRPDLALALVELRLEAARSPEVATVVGPFLREGFAADVAFHEGRDLPGGAETVLALHHLVDGLVLDRLTVPLDPNADPREMAARITRRLLAG